MRFSTYSRLETEIGPRAAGALIEENAPEVFLPALFLHRMDDARFAAQKAASDWRWNTTG